MKLKHIMIAIVIATLTLCINAHDNVCITCGSEHKIEHQHIFEYTRTIKEATINSGGILEDKCHICDITREETFICTHSTQSLYEVSPTCKDKGYIEIKCDKCKYIIEHRELNVIDHKFGEWTVNVRATPIAKGFRQRTCECGHIETEQYSYDKKYDNILYIPDSNIEAQVVVGYTQMLVDNYDVVMNEQMLGNNEIMLLGHDYKSLGKLPNTKIGDKVYLVLGDNILKYEVTVSEKGIDDYTYIDGVGYNSNIVGVETGTKIVSHIEDGALHIYTCYGNDRWIAIAVPVE